MDENNDQAFSPNKISILCCGNQIKDTKMKVMFTLHDLYKKLGDPERCHNLLD